MKAEQAKKLTDQALDELSEALQNGKSDAMVAYLDAMSRFHHYSFGNIMLIASQKPDAIRVAGFRSWKQFGRFVKKGEKGIVIIAPMLIKKKDENGRAEGDDESFLRFKAVYVFDVSQTDGEPLPEPTSVAGDPGPYTDALKHFVSAKAITLEYVNNLDAATSLGNADGASYGGRIALRDDLSPAGEFSVLVHELAHEMLHRGDNGTRPAKVVRETEAEAVAFVVSRAVGLETNTTASDYIQLYNGDKDTLAKSLDHIQHTATAIIDAIKVTDDKNAQAA